MKGEAISEFLKHSLMDPSDRSGIQSWNSDGLMFQKSKYAVVHNTPVLFMANNGLFNVGQITSNQATTQNEKFHDTKNVKNKIRKSLPMLALDTRQVARYTELNAMLAPGSTILVIGTGSKYFYYQDIFKDHVVINADVHNQFKVDVIFDAHQIPFKDETFDMVLSSQVLEHTMRPWIVAKEIMRVTKAGGVIHTEVPFCFPYHGQPYDFFRFSPGGLRVIFDQCSLLKSEVINGDGSAAAYMLSESLINKFKRENRYSRMMALFFSRLAFFWFKYFERVGPSHQKYKVVAAMNISQTMRKMSSIAADSVMIEEINTNFAR
jgi:SAM-dependent methyltransferase